MFGKRSKSIFEYAQETSIIEFSKKYIDSEIEISIPMDNKGAILVPIDMEDETTRALLYDYRYTLKEPSEITVNDGNNILCLKSSSLINDVTKGMIEISTYMTFKDSINTIYNIYKELNGELYGVFMVNAKGQKFNPLHPITALELMGSNNWTKNNYKLYIYSYSGEKKINELKDEFTRVKDKSLIEKNIASQIALHSQKHTMVQKVSSNISSASLIARFKNGLDPTILVQNEMQMSDNSKSRDSAFLIPHNILNNGISIPYYGSSIVNMSRRRGHQCSPMMSANIGFNSNSFLNKDTYISYNICTGRLSNATAIGLKSLNHSNLNSPLNRLLLQPGWRDYVDRCIDYSFMAYESIIEDYKQEFDDTFLEPKFETYMEEYFYINKEASIVDYLKHVAEKAKIEIKQEPQQTSDSELSAPF